MRQERPRATTRWWCDGQGPKLGRRADLVAYADPLRGLAHEELWAFALDDAGHMRAAIGLRGDVAGVAARPAELLGAVLAAGVRRVALVHNHPSGDPRPSTLDVAFTARLASAATLLGIVLCDHLIVARDGWRAIPCHAGRPEAQEARSAA